MSKRALICLFLCGLASAAVLPAQPPPPPPPLIVLAPQSLQPSSAQQAAILAALQLQALHGYPVAPDSPMVEVSISSNGISITYHAVGGPDVTIVLSNGPIFTKPDKTVWMTNVLVSHQLLDISNGF
jgi:hypothetical protein